MEKWYEIEKGLIPSDDYLIDCCFNEDSEIILWMIGKRRFRVSITGIMGFRIIDASSEIRDSYAELGLAKYRPEIYNNYIYEVQNAEFADKVKVVDDRLNFHHYKVVSLNFFIDIVAEGVLQVEECY